MNYLRIDYKGNMSPIPDNTLTAEMAEEKGHVLVVTGLHSRSRTVYDELSMLDVFSSCKPREMELKGATGTIRICSSLEWMHYAGLQLSSAYITRDATLDFVFRIMSKCRFPPNFYLTTSQN